MSKPDLFLLDDTLWILTAPTGVPNYEFDFREFFSCKTPKPRVRPKDPQELLQFFQRPLQLINVVVRVGALDVSGMASVFAFMDTHRLVLNSINSDEQRFRCSYLRGWYPLLRDLTLHSKAYDYTPSVAEVATEFNWPIFIQRGRKTRHDQRALSITSNPDAFHGAMRVTQQDRIFRAQPVVIRELFRLRPVEDPSPNRVPVSFEFRTFWWRGLLVGSGRYWWEGQPYDWNEKEKAEGLAVAREAASRLNVPFLVIDIAQTVEGRWIVIDCNDGQDSEYAGASALGIWQNILTIERQLKDKPA